MDTYECSYLFLTWFTVTLKLVRSYRIHSYLTLNGCRHFDTFDFHFFLVYYDESVFIHMSCTLLIHGHRPTLKMPFSSIQYGSMLIVINPLFFLLWNFLLLNGLGPSGFNLITLLELLHVSKDIFLLLHLIMNPWCSKLYLSKPIIIARRSTCWKIFAIVFGCNSNAEPKCSQSASLLQWLNASFKTLQ